MKRKGFIRMSNEFYSTEYAQKFIAVIFTEGLYKVESLPANVMKITGESEFFEFVSIDYPAPQYTAITKEKEGAWIIVLQKC